MATPHVTVTVDYTAFFHIPPRPTRGNDCSAKCKICLNNYKYTMSSKGNLLKHLQVSHASQLESYRESRRQSLAAGQSTLTGERRGPQQRYQNQDKVATSLVLNLIGHGGLPIQTCEQPWFRSFINDIEPRFKPISRVTVKRKLEELYKNNNELLMSEIAVIAPRKPSVTIDFWTSRDGRSFMGCTVHYIVKGSFKNNMLFFKEVPPPHTAVNVRNRFEDQLDQCNIQVFMVVSDNASNMKCAFTMIIDPVTNPENECGSELSDSDDPDDNTDESTPTHYWTETCPLKFESWLGCAAHSLQLVVHKGYKELLNYRRVQAVFNKVKAIAKLSRQSSHFKYALTRRIPVANETRWNSHYRLHQHIIKHSESINNALLNPQVQQNHLVLTATDIDNLSHVVNVMLYFSEATDLLQQDQQPTANQVIPVVDSLENALRSIPRDNAAKNALCEALLNSLQSRFSYLLDSALHQAATALDPRVKLTFTVTNDTTPGKFFVFNSTDVEEKIKGLLPAESGPQSNTNSIQETPQIEISEPSRKKKLLDFSTGSQQPRRATSQTQTQSEIATYLAHPTLDVDPVKFWMERQESPLQTLALEVLSVPCSSAPVERLFSKAGIILNQRRTRLQSQNIEQLLFFK